MYSAFKAACYVLKMFLQNVLLVMWPHGLLKNLWGIEHITYNSNPYNSSYLFSYQEKHHRLGIESYV